MHCPRCGHQQDSDKIQFCTKCGLEISGVKDLLTPRSNKTKAERKDELIKARKQGMIVMFSSFALIIVFAALREYFPIPKAFALIMLLFMVGGALRMSAPTLFARSARKTDDADLAENATETDRLSGNKVSDKSLPEAEYRPPLDLETSTFDTGDLVSPASVTENTTRKLKKELRQEEN